MLEAPQLTARSVDSIGLLGKISTGKRAERAEIKSAGEATAYAPFYGPPSDEGVCTCVGKLGGMWNVE